MLTTEEKFALDMYRSLTRGDPREVFRDMKKQILRDFEFGYKAGFDGKYETHKLLYPEYVLLNDQDRQKLHLMILQSLQAGAQAFTVMRLTNLLNTKAE
jgi:hypothetical protein